MILSRMAKAIIVEKLERAALIMSYKPCGSTIKTVATFLFFIFKDNLLVLC